MLSEVFVFYGGPLHEFVGARVGRLWWSPEGSEGVEFGSVCRFRVNPSDEVVECRDIRVSGSRDGEKVSDGVGGVVR